MVIADRRALLSPMSATYRQVPWGHVPTATASQSTTFAPVTRTRPLTAPAEVSANTTGSPESLCDQSTPGVRWLAAMPLASGNSRKRDRSDATRQPAADEESCDGCFASLGQPSAAASRLTSRAASRLCEKRPITVGPRGGLTDRDGVVNGQVGTADG